MTIRQLAVGLATVYEDPATRKVVLPAEAMLTFDWAAIPGKEEIPRVFSFVVTSGTLYVSRNGGEAVAYPAATGKQEFRVSGSQTERLTLTTSADGAATLLKCRSASGLVLIVR